MMPTSAPDSAAPIVQYSLTIAFAWFEIPMIPPQIRKATSAAPMPPIASR